MRVNEALKRARVFLRARRVKTNSWRYFDNAVYHCARVSATNKDLSFCVCHSGIFRGPKIIPCNGKDPDLLRLTESGHVIVRNGVVYELKQYAVH